MTKEVWAEVSDDEPNSHMNVDENLPDEETQGGNVPTPEPPPMDFGDDEINSADRLTRMVSPVLSFKLPECCR